MERRIRLYYINGKDWREFENQEAGLEAILAKMPSDAKFDNLLPCHKCGAINPLYRPGTNSYFDEVGFVIESSEFEPIEKGGLIPDFRLDLKGTEPPVELHP